MKTIEVLGHVDDQHRLHADVPLSIAPGEVKLLVLVPENGEEYGWPTSDLTEDEWRQYIAHGMRAELEDSRQDIYSLEDGESVDETK